MIEKQGEKRVVEKEDHDRLYKQLHAFCTDTLFELLTKKNDSRAWSEIEIRISTKDGRLSNVKISDEVSLK